MVVRKGDMADTTVERDGTTDKLAFFKAGSDDERAGLSFVVIGASDFGEVTFVMVSREHQVGADFLAQKSAPLGVALPEGWL